MKALKLVLCDVHKTYFYMEKNNMILQINGKSLLKCSEEDIKLIIDNPNFKENNYIDYKENFSFIEIQDKSEKNKKKIEFRNDICSFANAEGGFLIYGVKEKQGIATEIIGVDIPNNNTDKFELDRRNDLLPIDPRIPNLQFNCIELLTGKYVVIIYVRHDSFAPYTHIENQANYKFFKRAGNEKITMTYTELRNMFNQSLSLDKEIQNYRKERITYYKEQSEEIEDVYSKFILLHIIPDTFLDIDYNHNLFAIEKKEGKIFSSIFSKFGCDTTSIPCIDGLKFLPYSFSNTPSICYIYNNGILETFWSLKGISLAGDNFFPSEYIWEKIDSTITEYLKIFRDNKLAERVFVCLSIIGCKGMISQPASYSTLYKGEIDRNNIMCVPIVIDDIFDINAITITMKKIYVDYLLSISVKHNKVLEEYIKDLYK